MKRKQQRGFTLMELLITMVVTIFGLMGVLALHISLTQGNETAGRTQEAVAIGSRALEDLRAQRITDMARTLTGSPTATPPFTKTNYLTTAGRNGVSYQVDVTVSTVNGSSNLWKLRATVTWTDDSSTTSHTVPFEVIRTVQEAM